MKKLYVKPVAEELQEILAATILEATGDGELPGYGYGGDTFDW